MQNSAESSGNEIIIKPSWMWCVAGKGWAQTHDLNTQEVTENSSFIDAENPKQNKQENKIKFKMETMN